MAVVEEPMKEEFYLQINDFQKIDTIDGLRAVARLIQTLMILQPNTYPNHPEMGIGISNYEFEYGDDITINEMKSNITDQIDTYIGSSVIRNVNVEIVQNEYDGRKNKVVIQATLTNGEDFYETFEPEQTTGKIISKIFI